MFDELLRRDERLGPYMPEASSILATQSFGGQVAFQADGVRTCFSLGLIGAKNWWLPLRAACELMRVRPSKIQEKSDCCLSNSSFTMYQDINSRVATAEEVSGMVAQEIITPLQSQNC